MIDRVFLLSEKMYPPVGSVNTSRSDPVSLRPPVCGLGGGGGAGVARTGSWGVTQCLGYLQSTHEILSSISSNTKINKMLKERNPLQIGVFSK